MRHHAARARLERVEELVHRGEDVLVVPVAEKVAPRCGPLPSMFESNFHFNEPVAASSAMAPCVGVVAYSIRRRSS